MANVKTAISLQETLFAQAEDIARDMHISRSRLFALALEGFIREYQDRKLFEQINKACEDGQSDGLVRQDIATHTSLFRTTFSTTAGCARCLCVR